MIPDTPSWALDYYPCRYPGSKLWFRGPPVRLSGAYTAILGGAEVYGPYVEDPFSDQLAERTGQKVVNLGVHNASVDVFLNDEGIMDIVSRAAICIVQATGAHNVSNRFYRVHPRRNDRFLKASSQLVHLYRDVDFSQFSFTRHMLSTLRTTCPKRFLKVEEELSQAWIGRMRGLLAAIPGPCILLHLLDRRDFGLGPEPPFITAEMVAALADDAQQIVSCKLPPRSEQDRLAGLAFPQEERARALRGLGWDDHNLIADALTQAVMAWSDQAA